GGKSNSSGLNGATWVGAGGAGQPWLVPWLEGGGGMAPSPSSAPGCVLIGIGGAGLAGPSPPLMKSTKSAKFSTRPLPIAVGWRGGRRGGSARAAQLAGGERRDRAQAAAHVAEVERLDLAQVATHLAEVERGRSGSRRGWGRLPHVERLDVPRIAAHLAEIKR